ncbi:cuticle protein CP14.6-like [Diabrotica undecimpunctata]|uniref:cuticle protein CP14.6-like n=1 Tax=Diabrotica undecimpunctata TaxID=50387 RepID=UPI003B641437
MLLKALISFCVLWSVATARPQYSNDGQYDNGNQYDNNNGYVASAGGHNQAYQDSRSAVITRYDSDSDGAGTYNYNITQSDGIYNEQVGTIENQGTDQESSRVYGYYAYPGPDGIFYYVEYVADKDGFRPAGKHIPQSAGVGRVGQLGIPSAAIASLAGGGLG